VRGLCCLRPGIEGLSDNIRVVSLTGRFLEHARVFFFQNAPESQRLYIGSADMMRRNLYNRVEVVTPVVEPRLQHRLLRILQTDLANTSGAWQLLPTGEYVRLDPADGQPPLDSQATFMQDAFGLPKTP
jgi:polyphosphate kinase